MNGYRTFRWLAAFAAAMLVEASAFAGPPDTAPSAEVSQNFDLPAAQVRAAGDDATDHLRQAILATPLARHLTLADQLGATGGTAGLDDILATARQVGGPRWVDGRTCQVELALSGAPIIDLLVRQAAREPDRSPLPPDVLRSRLHRWADRVFIAVGNSAIGESIESARPAAAGAWAGVDDASCRRAIDAARADAAARELDALAALPPPSPQLNLRAELAQPAARQSLTELLCRQPVTRVEFLDNLRVSVTIAPVPQSLAAGVCRVVRLNGPAAPPLPQPTSSQLAQLISTRQWSCVGTASVAPPAAPADVLPTQAPSWLDRQMETEASVAVIGGASPLHVARLAQQAALAKLRAQFLALPVDPHRTIGDVVKVDPRLSPGLDRALEHAHPMVVEYHADGSVLVRVELSLRQAWDELNASTP